MQNPSPDQEDPLEKEMATPSSILAWRIPWTEDPLGLQSMGLDTTEQITHARAALSPVQAYLSLLQRANSMARVTPQEMTEAEEPVKEANEIKAGVASWEGGA